MYSLNYGEAATRHGLILCCREYVSELLFVVCYHHLCLHQDVLRGSDFSKWRDLGVRWRTALKSLKYVARINVNWIHLA